tara:strand:- start:600 stop:1181 length:582 start_codon:yes stop_codon:yes gene_type:complete
MTKLWYNDLKVLKDEPFQFIPSNNLTEHQKVNALARLGIYIIIIMHILKIKSSYLSVPILLIVTSFFLGRTEKFSNNHKQKCYRPTDDNPFMNFTLDDYYKNVNRPANCPVDEVRGEIRKKFLKKHIPDPTDIWGQNINDRNFYTMPNTRVVNDQKGFANWCYSSIGQCKANGKNCLKYALSRTGTGMFGSAI